MIKKFIKRLITSFLIVIAFSLLWFAFHRLIADSRSLQVVELPLTVEKAPKGAALRIGAYNIAHGRGGKLGESNWTSTTRKEGEVHLQKIITQIKASKLDVLVLNEVDFDANWSGGYNQAQFIAEQTGFPHLACLANIDIDLPFFDLQFGNAILSKLPLEGIESIELPPVKRWEPLLAGKKNALEATINWNGKPITFVAIHIETRSQETRLQSVEVLSERIQKTDTPFVLLGDFNSQRINTGTSAVDFLLEKQAFTTDVDSESWKTFPSESPDRGIDWILVNDPIEIRNTQVVSSNLSDHLMITAEIQINEG